MLVRWAIERARISKTPLYLESTLEAVPFYKRLGFTKETTISLEYTSAETGKPETYMEEALIFRSF